VAVSAPSLGHGFVFDDVWIVEDREIVREADFPSLLTDAYWPEERGAALWRPVTLVAFAIEWAVGDGSPVVFHAANVALYALVAALVALLAARAVTPVVGLVAGALFAVHPIHVEVSANVVGQAELISAAAFLGVLLVAWRTLDGSTTRVPRTHVVAVSLLTLVGIGAKEHVATLPAAIVVLWWLSSVRTGEPLREVARRQIAVLFACLISVGAYLAGRAAVLGEATSAGGVASGLPADSWVQRGIVMLPVSLEWLRLLFWPVRLSADYSPSHLVPEATFGSAHVAALVVWAILLGLAWRFRLRLPVAAAGVALFVVTGALAANIVVPLEVLLAERLLFLPSAGFALALGGLAASTSTRRSRALAFGVVGTATILLASRSLERVPFWANNEVFFARMAVDAPLSARVSRLAAEDALAAGDTARAEVFVREALARDPYDPAPAEAFGRSLFASGRYEGAAAYLREAVQRAPERQGALQILVIALTRLGEGTEAIRWVDRLEEIHGVTIESQVLRIEALRSAARFAEAFEAAERALEGRPEDWNLHRMAAESARAAGLCEPALDHLERGIAFAPVERRGDFLEIQGAIESGQAICR
jgi:tetratricopeptide (TPR) repeat protein